MLSGLFCLLCFMPTWKKPEAYKRESSTRDAAISWMCEPGELSDPMPHFLFSHWCRECLLCFLFSFPLKHCREGNPALCFCPLKPGGGLCWSGVQNPSPWSVSTLNNSSRDHAERLGLFWEPWCWTLRSMAKGWIGWQWERRSFRTPSQGLSLLWSPTPWWTEAIYDAWPPWHREFWCEDVACPWMGQWEGNEWTWLNEAKEGQLAIVTLPYFSLLDCYL